MSTTIVNNYIMKFFQANNISVEIQELWNAEKNQTLFSKVCFAKKSKKSANAVKGKTSAFIFFSTENRAEIKNQLGVNATFGSIAKSLGKQWKLIKDTPKADKYNNLASADKKRFDDAMSNNQSTDKDIKSFTVKELKEQCKNNGIKGFSKMKKCELEQALQINPTKNEVEENNEENKNVSKQLTMKQLRDKAKSLNISGYSKLKKDDLLKKIAKNQVEDDEIVDEDEDVEEDEDEDKDEVEDNIKH